MMNGSIEELLTQKTYQPRKRGKISVKRLVSCFSRKKKTIIHFYSERNHVHGSSYQEGNVSIDTKLTGPAVEALRDWLDGEFEKDRPNYEWTGRTKIMSVTVLDRPTPK
jgi:hypothetical protein